MYRIAIEIYILFYSSTNLYGRTLQASCRTLAISGEPAQGFQRISIRDRELRESGTAVRIIHWSRQTVTCIHNRSGLAVTCLRD